MFLRVIGILILASFPLGAIVLVMGLRRKPELIRQISVSSLFTSGGLLCIGFGLAFGVGFGRVLLVAGGAMAYLYGLALSLLKRAERKRSET